jgi:glycosyltransferase involved in cell wall biosynthesis
MSAAGSRVSVVVETVTAREDAEAGPLADVLGKVLAALALQTYPRELVQTVVVLDDEVAAEEGEELRRRHPSVELAHAPRCNYFAAKNAGAQHASGAIVAFVDSDCEPASDWLERLVAPFDAGAEVVVGHTRYAGGSLLARTFSVPDFDSVVADPGGGASGIMLNNSAFRRALLLAHPLEARIRRNGGCYLLYHELRAAGSRVVYERRARVSHGLDIRGFGFVRKHFDRGYDGTNVYRLDNDRLLRGTAWVARFGALALPAIVGRRIVLDWGRLLRHRREIGIAPLALPYFAGVVLATRLIELVGGLVAIVDRRGRP